MDSGNVSALVTSIQSVPMNTLNWVLFVLVALIGGFASSLINNKGAIERMGWDDPEPQKRKKLKVGLIADLVAGLAAALAILWTMTPQTFFQLIGISAVAGYGGSAVLQALVNRLTADVSKAEKEKIEEDKKKLEEEKKILEEKKVEIEGAETALVTKKAEISIIDKLIEIQKGKI